MHHTTFENDIRSIKDGSESNNDDENQKEECEEKISKTVQKYSGKSKSDQVYGTNEDKGEKKSRRKSDLLDMRMSQLLKKPNESSQPKKVLSPPKKRQSSDITSLLSKLDKKFNPSEFTEEQHLKPGDPGYGTPKEGTKTAARGRKAHGDISGEIVKLCQVIWDFGQNTGR